MPVPTPSRRHPLLRRYVLKPWTVAAQRSPALRRYCDEHHYITPHFSWASYACSDGTQVPRELRANARRLHLDLERFRHAIGDLAVTVNGAFRTHARNDEVRGARDSRHLHGDAADLYKDQVDGWVARAKHLKSRADVIRIAERIFTATGNETSGTLHVDSRPGPKVFFVTWKGV